jgi:lauroyl/myristoyl acyltransferase
MPEWPLILAAVPRVNGLALIAQDAAWIRRAVGSSSVLPFRKAGAVVALARAFRSGRPIAAMLDYCYDETAAVEAPFLGRMSRTPIGLFALARRYGYRIDVLSVADGAACTVEQIESREVAISDNVMLAGTVNAAIGRQVLLDPARWLLWPALDRRWTGSDAVPIA